MCRFCAERELLFTGAQSALGGLGRYDRWMADQTPAPALSLDQQLQEIGAQLAWVRDYL